MSTTTETTTTEAGPDMSWRRGPVVPVELTEGKVTGRLEVTWTDETHASVLTTGHVNDTAQRPDDAVTYRGEQYLVHFYVYRAAGGTLTLGDYRHATRRETWTNAPRTYADALALAALEAVRSTVTPETMRAAAYAGACDRHSRALRDLEEAQQVLREAQAKRVAARKVLREAARVAADNAPV